VVVAPFSAVHFAWFTKQRARRSSL